MRVLVEVVPVVVERVGLRVAVQPVLLSVQLLGVEAVVVLVATVLVPVLRVGRVVLVPVLVFVPVFGSVSVLVPVPVLVVVVGPAGWVLHVLMGQWGEMPFSLAWQEKENDFSRAKQVS